MNEIKLPRSHRREMQNLLDRADQVIQGDRRFFQRFPHRQHQVRPACEAQNGQLGIWASDGVVPHVVVPPPSYRHYVAVRHVAPGERVRRSLSSHAGIDVDVDKEPRWLTMRHRALKDVVQGTEVRA